MPNKIKDSSTNKLLENLLESLKQISSNLDVVVNERNSDEQRIKELEKENDLLRKRLKNSTDK